MAEQPAQDPPEVLQNQEQDPEAAVPSIEGNNKRKFEDAEPGTPAPVLPGIYSTVPPPASDFDLLKQKAADLVAKFSADGEAKRSKLEEGRTEQDPSSNNLDSQDVPPAFEEQPPGGDSHGLAGQQNEFNQFQQDGGASTKKIDVPNSKVGLVIGKSGETIKYLQQQSGARIQVTRDADTDPRSQARPVELVGTPDQILLAEKLINDVITEEYQSRNGQAGAGGSGALVARGFGGLGPPGDSVIIKVPNNKVGLIIGRGGETIKNLQNRSGARIQVQSDREVETGALERSVTLIGNKKATEMASELIAEVVDENRRGPPLQGGGGFSGAGGYRGQSQWGPPPGPPMQQGGGSYGGYQQPAYQGPPQQQYGGPPQQQYSGYPQQPAGGFQSGWDQRPAASAQPVQQPAGYDYYGQQTQPVAASAPAAAAPADSSYSYGQQSQGYYGYQQPPTQPAAAGYQQPGYGQQQQQQQQPQAYTQPGYAGQQQTQQQSQQQPATSYNGYSYSQQGTGASDQAAGYSQQGYTQQSYTQPGYTQPSSEAASTGGSYDYGAPAQTTGGSTGGQA